MGKTKVKTKAKVAKPAPKANKTASKPEKSAKGSKAAASKGKEEVVQKGKAAKPMPAAAKAKVEPKKAKAPKKEAKAKKTEEEDDLFDDGEITDSEELLEYEKDLELSEDDEDAESDESGDDDEADADLETESDEELAVDQDDSDDLEASGEEDEEDIYLTDAEGNRYCRAKDCDQISAVDGYCRYHYLLLWKKIQVRKEILQDGKLEKYVDDLTSRYPDKFLEMLRKDLRTTKDFMAAIAELEIDESAGEGEFEEDAQTYIDEVRGISDAGGASMEDDEF